MKAKNLSKSELKTLQEYVGKINQVHIELGRLENQKHKILHNMEELDNDFAELQKEIEDKYGKVSVNIEDGVLSEIPENDAK
jgi:predicted transcriptional regulator|tara:strand:+ start:217 stop:462 length:246 start_codon:yes stop_codon:yes gene_type:complete